MNISCYLVQQIVSETRIWAVHIVANFLFSSYGSVAALKDSILWLLGETNEFSLL